MKTKTNSSANANDSECRAYGEWEPKIQIKRESAQHGGFSRKVVTEGDAYVTVPLETITKLLRQGKQVILSGRGSNDAIRLFPCLTTDLTEMFVAAQTVGDFRHSIGDIKFSVRHRGLRASSSDCARLVADAAERHEAKKRQQLVVCPSRHVTCPVCGADLELGSLVAGSATK